MSVELESHPVASSVGIAFKEVPEPVEASPPAGPFASHGCAWVASRWRSTPEGARAVTGSSREQPRQFSAQVLACGLSGSCETPAFGGQKLAKDSKARLERWAKRDSARDRSRSARTAIARFFHTGRQRVDSKPDRAPLRVNDEGWLTFWFQRHNALALECFGAC